MARLTVPVAIVASVMGVLLITGAFAELATARGGLADQGSLAIVRYRETLSFERGGATLQTAGIMQSRLQVTSGGIGPVYNGQGVKVSNEWLEAIPIEVGGGDYVFALPTYPYDASKQRLMLLYTACDLPETDRGRDVAALKSFINLVASLDRVCEVPLSSWPVLIHFKDRTNPQTAERLFPADLEREFGVHLESVTVERTDAPPTRGIEALLPWVLDKKQTFWMPIVTVEDHPRSRPIVLTQEDFLWPSPIRQAASRH